MKIIGLIVLAALAAAPVSAEEAAPPSCVEKSEVRFLSGGREVPSEKVGVEDPCDEFGGDLVYTPKHRLYLYVNFNIPGTVDLDAVDRAMDGHDASLRRRLLKIHYAVVGKAWMERRAEPGTDAFLNWGKDSLFISERVLAENRLPALLAGLGPID